MFIICVLVGVFFVGYVLNLLTGKGLTNLENKVDSYNQIIKNQKEK